ncbi:MAG: transglycosylase SLT domain-containing protein [Alphaproteobacteria bacterium]|nr:transglycosylase SLT domain-containing protein [Alphaproteobacteria bacterium]
MIISCLFPRLTLGFVCAAVLFTAATARAQTVSVYDLCAAAAFEAEKLLQIPTFLLQAIALTESGRWYKSEKHLKPWPWAVSAQKQSWYFPSKEAAVDHVQKLQQQKVTNIDVGCMQINLHYHGKIFKNLDETFNPINNVAYAGIFLSELYKMKTSWNQAVKFYHSANPQYNRRYIKVVYESWKKLKKQAHDQQEPVQLGLQEPVDTLVGFLGKKNALLPENAQNHEIQTILQPEEIKKQQENSLLADIICYDAFARVQAAQLLEREFGLYLDNVPPPIIQPMDLLRQH